MNKAPVSRLTWTPATAPEELHAPLRRLGEEYPLAERQTGATLTFARSNRPGHLRVQTARDGVVAIEYGAIPAALRGVAHALAGGTVEEDTPFTMLGIMLDCSRGAVMTVSYLKTWMRRLALLGYNTVMLYTEDTYQLPGEPYFGYMRGGYSMAEMKELDAYARSLGIEMIACIQTLGHMEQILKWDYFRGVMDTEHVLLADEEQTYQLIEKMIAFWSEALHSRRIHVGMDEAHELGRGKFQDRFGYQRQFDIFNRHLARVADLCAQRGLKPMIWSDMYFKMGSPRGAYCDPDTVIPDDVKAAIPGQVDLVYWDYCHENEAFYAEWIRRHRELGSGPLVASGIWTWARFWYDHTQTVASAGPCIRACRRERVPELLFTMWGDGGGYCEYDSAWTGLTWAADLAFGGDGNDDHVAPLFAAVCGGDYGRQLIPCGLQVRPGEGYPEVKTSTMVWDDPLFGIGWTEYRSSKTDCWPVVLQRLRAMRETLAPETEPFSPGDLTHAWNLCDLLIKKIEFREALVAAYAAKDRDALLRLAQHDVPVVMAALDAVMKTFRRQWLRRNKPFGMEVIQIRLSSQIARYEETALRIRELLDGHIESIAELDVKVDNRGHFVGFYDWLATGSLRV